LQEHTIVIQALVYEGGGFGRLPDGRAVFVPFVMPNEKVRIGIIEEHAGYAHAELLEIENSHPRRQTARCAHFGICGGCHYQHIPYDLQLEFKRDIFAEQLERIARISHPKIEKVVPTQQPWDYRNAIQFQVSPLGELCYSMARDQSLFAVQECHLPMKALNDLWPRLQFEKGAFGGRLELRQNAEKDVLLVLDVENQETPALESQANLSVVALAGEEQVVLAGDDHLLMQIRGRELRVSAGSFFQVNFSAAEALLQEVRALVERLGCRRLLDVYCGVGFFSVFLADQVAQVAAVESNPFACHDFAQNLDEFDHVSLYQGSAEEVLPILKFPADVAILDPPRAGVRPAALRALIAMQPAFLIYVSCNPATLARDARHLVSAGYDLSASVLLDIFPQTYHMESVNLFTRR